MAKKTVDINATVKEKTTVAEPKEFVGKVVLDAELPALPALTENKTYALRLVNGVKTWVEIQG